jgi:[protein-PII] uridylyltransferase
MTAQDRPGLLYDVSAVISKRCANIEVVLVTTEARKAIDVFYVTKIGAKLKDEEAKDLADAILAVIKPAS